MKQRLESSVNAEDKLQQQVEAQQRQVDDANTHCEALQNARQEAEEELQVCVLARKLLQSSNRLYSSKARDKRILLLSPRLSSRAFVHHYMLQGTLP